MSATVIDRPEQIAALRTFVAVQAIVTKVRTGMNLTRINPLPVYREISGTQVKTYKAAYKDALTRFPEIMQRLGVDVEGGE